MKNENEELFGLIGFVIGFSTCTLVFWLGGFDFERGILLVVWFFISLFVASWFISGE